MTKRIPTFPNRPVTDLASAIAAERRAADLAGYSDSTETARDYKKARKQTDRWAVGKRSPSRSGTEGEI